MSDNEALLRADECEAQGCIEPRGHSGNHSGDACGGRAMSDPLREAWEAVKNEVRDCALNGHLDPEKYIRTTLDAVRDAMLAAHDGSCFEYDRFVRECPKRATVRALALTLPQLQQELLAWQEHNFPGREAWEPLLGVAEECGELAHAHLKQHQRIRGTPEELEAKAKDAVADIIVYLADYANARGFDLQECLETAWAEVKQRDWQEHRKGAQHA